MSQERSTDIPFSILGSAFLLSFCMGTRNLCIPPMEHIIRGELNVTYSQTGLLFTIPVIMSAILCIPAGILVDKIGLRKMGGIGVILLATGAVLRGFSFDYTSLLIFTFIIGAGGAFLLPSIPKLISLWVPRERIGIVMGTNFTGVAVGGGLCLAITLPLIFPIIGTFQGTFLIWSIPSIAATIIWWIMIKEPPHISSLEVEVAPTNTPLLPVLKNKILWSMAAFGFLAAFFNLNWMAWAPSLLMSRGATAEQASLITSILQWVTIVSLIFAPRLSNRIGLRKPFLWLSSIILALVTLWAVHMTVSMAWIIMILVGIINSARQITLQILPLEIMPREVVGTASGMIMSIGFIGGMVGALTGGYILDITGSFDSSLFVLIGVSIAAAGITLTIPETGPRTRLVKYQHNQITG